MKARVKATGEIVEVIRRIVQERDYLEYVWYYRAEDRYYKEYELEFNINDLPKDESDYWEKLKHQYAGMAMQQMVNHVNQGYEYVYEETAIIALNFAIALVNKLKEESQCEK